MITSVESRVRMQICLLQVIVSPNYDALRGKFLLAGACNSFTLFGTFFSDIAVFDMQMT